MDLDHNIRPVLYTGVVSNCYGYSNKELDRLLDESSAAVDVKKWIEIWKKIQYLLAEDGAFVPPQVGPTRFEVIQDDVKGYHFLPSTSRI